MSGATGYDAARAWLAVARSALENAAACENALSDFEHDHYVTLRGEVEELIRLAEMSFRQAEIMKHTFSEAARGHQ